MKIIKRITNKMKYLFNKNEDFQILLSEYKKEIQVLKNEKERLYNYYTDNIKFEQLLKNGIDIYLNYNLHRKRNINGFNTIFNALKKGNYVIGEYCKNAVRAYDLNTLEEYIVIKGFYSKYADESYPKNIVYLAKGESVNPIIDYNHKLFYIYNI